MFFYRLSSGHHCNKGDQHSLPRNRQQEGPRLRVPNDLMEENADPRLEIGEKEEQNKHGDG